MIDDFDGDAAGFWFVEGAGNIAVERRPGFLVDFRFQCRLQCLVGIVCAQEIGMADEEAFFVVVRIDKPAGNTFGAIAADFAGTGMKDINTTNSDL